jgi:hypothetical protein
VKHPCWLISDWKPGALPQPSVTVCNESKRASERLQSFGIRLRVVDHWNQLPAQIKVPGKAQIPEQLIEETKTKGPEAK